MCNYLNMNKIIKTGYYIKLFNNHFNDNDLHLRTLLFLAS